MRNDITPDCHKRVQTGIQLILIKMATERERERDGKRRECQQNDLEGEKGCDSEENRENEREMGTNECVDNYAILEEPSGGQSYCMCRNSFRSINSFTRIREKKKFFLAYVHKLLCITTIF